mmetsp:Transcript_87044/g.186561  ORF Transcript_87044/g.186561 Transcript_87044/m.186561 type:complete len:207 (+) Transcript_87044:127-747(+)
MQAVAPGTCCMPSCLHSCGCYTWGTSSRRHERLAVPPSACCTCCTSPGLRSCGCRSPGRSSPPDASSPAWRRRAALVPQGRDCSAPGVRLWRWHCTCRGLACLTWLAPPWHCRTCCTQRGSRSCGSRTSNRTSPLASCWCLQLQLLAAPSSSPCPRRSPRRHHTSSSPLASAIGTCCRPGAWRSCGSRNWRRASRQRGCSRRAEEV